MADARDPEGLTQEEIHFVITQIERWLRIGYPDKRPTEADVSHSALLRRLLEGNEPLDEAPPRYHSYPWYSLLEEGEAVGGFEVRVMASGESVFEGLRGPIVILAGGLWEVVAVEGEEMIVRWPESGLRARLEPRPREEVLAEIQEQIAARPEFEEMLIDSALTSSGWRLTLLGRSPGIEEDGHHLVRHSGPREKSLGDGAGAASASADGLSDPSIPEPGEVLE